MTLLLSGDSGCIRSACTVASMCFYDAVAASVDVVSARGGGGSCVLDVVMVL